MPDQAPPAVQNHPLHPGKSDLDLLRWAVTIAKPRTSRGWQPRWVAVMDTFGLGRTYACGLCERFGLDPSEKVRQ